MHPMHRFHPMHRSRLHLLLPLRHSRPKHRSRQFVQIHPMLLRPPLHPWLLMHHWLLMRHLPQTRLRHHSRHSNLLHLLNHLLHLLPMHRLRPKHHLNLSRL